MGRYMLDTNIFVFYVDERDRLSDDVTVILDDFDSQLCISAESVRELIVAFRTKRLLANLWHSPRALVDAIERDYKIRVIPVDLNVNRTMSDLVLNEAEKHNDPSDHIIISHALTLGIPLISSDHMFRFYRSQGLDLIENRMG